MLLQSPDASQAEINQKLAALRQARANAKRKLVLAQQELRKVLNFRQQARLVLMGLLD
jgi:pantothenate kinase-related protein Tda10